MPIFSTLLAVRADERHRYVSTAHPLHHKKCPNENVTYFGDSDKVIARHYEAIALQL